MPAEQLKDIPKEQSNVQLSVTESLVSVVMATILMATIPGFYHSESSREFRTKHLNLSFLSSENSCVLDFPKGAHLMKSIKE